MHERRTFDCTIFSQIDSYAIHNTECCPWNTFFIWVIVLYLFAFLCISPHKYMFLHTYRKYFCSFFAGLHGKFPLSAAGGCHQLGVKGRKGSYWGEGLHSPWRGGQRISGKGGAQIDPPPSLSSWPGPWLASSIPQLPSYAILPVFPLRVEWSRCLLPLKLPGSLCTCRWRQQWGCGQGWWPSCPLCPLLFYSNTTFETCHEIIISN